VAVIEETPPTELERVENWRCWQLILAGMECSRARRLSRTDADLHKTLRLLAAGCPEHLAFEIMR